MQQRLAGISPRLLINSFGVVITSFAFPVLSLTIPFFKPLVPRNALTPPVASPPVTVSAKP